MAPEATDPPAAESPRGAGARGPAPRRAAAARVRSRRAALDPPRRARGPARHLRGGARGGLGHRARRARGPRDRGGARVLPGPLPGPAPPRAACASTGWGASRAAPTAASPSDGRRRGVDLPPQPHRLLRAPPGRGLRRPPVHRRDGGRRPASSVLPRPRRAPPAVPQRARDPARGHARRRGRGPDGGRDVRDRGPAQLVRRVASRPTGRPCTSRTRWRWPRGRASRSR